MPTKKQTIQTSQTPRSEGQIYQFDTDELPKDIPSTLSSSGKISAEEREEALSSSTPQAASDLTASDIDPAKPLSLLLDYLCEKYNRSLERNKARLRILTVIGTIAIATTGAGIGVGGMENIQANPLSSDTEVAEQESSIDSLPEVLSVEMNSGQTMLLQGVNNPNTPPKLLFTTGAEQVENFQSVFDNEILEALQQSPEVLKQVLEVLLASLHTGEQDMEATGEQVARTVVNNLDEPLALYDILQDEEKLSEQAGDIVTHYMLSGVNCDAVKGAEGSSQYDRGQIINSGGGELLVLSDAHLDTDSAKHSLIRDGIPHEEAVIVEQEGEYLTGVRVEGQAVTLVKQVMPVPDKTLLLALSGILAREGDTATSPELQQSLREKREELLEQYEDMEEATGPGETVVLTIEDGIDSFQLRTGRIVETAGVTGGSVVFTSDGIIATQNLQ